MTKILAIDTSTHACSAALYIDGWVEERYQYAPRLHGELLLTMVDELLAQQQLSLTDIDALAYGAGPGSFTGVRLAASAIQGLSFGAQKPVIAISSLLAQADAFYKYLGYSQIACAFDARMSEVYWGAYQFSAGEWVAAVPDCVIAPNKIASLPPGNWVGVGDGWGSYSKELKEKTGVEVFFSRFYPHAASIAKLAAKEYQQNHFIESQGAMLPVYLRNKVV
jgi:tRNA threonylcarbamoyladenosine biosynthesis protein TsaB